MMGRPKTWVAQGVYSWDGSHSIEEGRWKSIVGDLKGAGVRKGFDEFKECINHAINQYYAHHSLKNESKPSNLKKLITGLEKGLEGLGDDQKCPSSIVDELCRMPYQLLQIIREAGGEQMTWHWRAVPMFVGDFRDVLARSRNLVDDWGIKGTLPQHEKLILLDLIASCLADHFDIGIATGKYSKHNPFYSVAGEVFEQCSGSRNIDKILEKYRHQVLPRKFLQKNDAKTT
jgi:hypothetical protein